MTDLALKSQSEKWNEAIEVLVEEVKAAASAKRPVDAEHYANALSYTAHAVCEIARTRKNNED